MPDFERVQRVATTAVDLLFPPLCPVCRTRRARLGLPCGTCRRGLGEDGGAACPRCATRRGPHARVEGCRECPLPFLAFVVAAGPYAGLRGELIRRVKYGGEAVLVGVLEAELELCLAAWEPGQRVELVVPVPRSPRRVERRRIHLAGRLASRAAALLNVPIAPRALRRVGSPSAQASLSRTERRRAPRGTVERASIWASALTPRVRSRHVLLVDDVLTTGGTASECARVLRRSGAASVSLVVIARA